MVLKVSIPALQDASRQASVPARQGISVVLGGATMQRQEALTYLYDWERGAG